MWYCWWDTHLECKPRRPWCQSAQGSSNAAEKSIWSSTSAMLLPTWHLVCWSWIHISRSEARQQNTAIKQVPPPLEGTAVNWFLGVIFYLHKFINNMSEKTAPLHQLLHKDAARSWEKQHQDAFNVLMDELCRAPVHHCDTLMYWSLSSCQWIHQSVVSELSPRWCTSCIYASCSLA